MYIIEPKPSSLLDARLTRKNYLQINTFTDLMLIEQKGNSHMLQKKAIREVISEMVKEIAGWTEPGLYFCKINISFN